MLKFIYCYNLIPSGVIVISGKSRKLNAYKYY